MQSFKRASLLFVSFVTALIFMLVITTSLHGKLWNAANHVNASPLSDGFAPPGLVSFNISSNSNKASVFEPDADCPFRHSPLYRSIFVYPSPRDALFESMKSSRSGASNDGTVPMWPWLEMNEQFRKQKVLIYSVKYNEMNHFSLEQYVHDIMTHPKSCLQTSDPEKATLFYVPHMETMHWRGLESLRQLPKDWVKKKMTPYGAALLAAIDGKYDLWEDTYGLTTHYWKRKHGADHFFVMAEPCNGLLHISGARGNTNYVKTQRQNRPPIIISHELSATYVRMYPKCATKNIVMPYANIDGKWFRGDFEQEAKAVLPVFLTEANESQNAKDDGRPILVHYRAGAHGPCKTLRRGLARNHRCGKSFKKLLGKQISLQVQKHLSKFCPCPAGDSPSARRMNDAVVAGCIPVVLSTDYVWPLSTDVDPTSNINPSTFSVRLNFSDFGRPMFDGERCQRVDGNLTLEEYLETIPSSEIRRLQEGMRKVAPQFEYYQRRNMSDTPLSDRLLPDGGAAHALVRELSKRAVENRWAQCQEELKLPQVQEPRSNPC